MNDSRETHRSHLSAALVLLLLAGCLPGDFGDFEELAPVRVHGMPGSERKEQDYGSVLATMRMQRGGRDVSYLAASGGRGSAIVLSRAWEGGGPSEERVQRCAGATECREGEQDIGGTLIPFPVWGRGGEDERTACVFAPVNFAAEGRASPQGWVVCESHKGPQQFGLGLGSLLAEGESLHFSGFGLPADHPLGVVLFGAHAQQDKAGGSGRHSGGLYRVPDRYQAEANMLSARAIRLRDPGAGGEEEGFFTSDPERGDLGHQVVGTVTQEGELLVALSQPSAGRVIVVAYDDRQPGPVEERFVTRACIRSPEAELRGFGERLAFGDVTGDGKPELFVGSDPLLGDEPGRQALYLYAGGGLPSQSAAESACPAWEDEPVQVACKDANGARCADSAFGASIAVGDIDGDGRGELLVGAPQANVDGTSGGAVWIIPGAAGGLDQERAVALVSRTDGGRFGTTVAALPSQAGRAEPVVGAPGLNNVFVYTCTPLESTLYEESYCLP